MFGVGGFYLLMNLGLNLHEQDLNPTCLQPRSRVWITMSAISMLITVPVCYQFGMIRSSMIWDALISRLLLASFFLLLVMLLHETGQYKLLPSKAR